MADAQGNSDLDLPMQNAITGYLRARDQLLQSTDGLDIYDHATNVLYAALI